CRRNSSTTGATSRMWVRKLTAVLKALLLALPLAGLVTAALPRAAAAENTCGVEPNALDGLKCDIGHGIANAAGNVAQGFADQAERALTKWVVDGAVWLLQQLANVVFNTTSPVLSVDWFRAHYAD